MADPNPNRVLRHLKSAVGPAAAGESDGVLLGRFADHRDESAFELLLWRHTALVHRVCRHVLRDHQQAEDATQATFLVLARKAGELRTYGTVAGWLYRVARRIAVRAAVRRGERGGSSAGLDGLPAASSTASDADTGRLVYDEVARLPERYRVPVLVCLVEGLTHADAARRLGWPIGTVAGRLARAKTVLADRLTRRGVTAVAAAMAAAGLDSATATQPAVVSATLSAALAFTAAGSVFPPVSADVVRLTRWEMKAMLTTRLLKLSAVFAAVGLTAVGVTALAQKPTDPPAVKAPDQKPEAKKPEFPDAGRQDRTAAMNNLKELTLAVLNYEAANGHLPTDVTDKAGKPLLSWRVLLLPYLEQIPLYQKLKLDEPWDSEHNKPLAAEMPDVFRCRTSPKGAADTHVQMFHGPGAFLEPGKRLTFAQPARPVSGFRPAADFPDPLGQTIALVEAGPPVPWTKPADVEYDPKKAFPKLAGPFANELHVAFADGTTDALRRDLDEKTLRVLVERNDGTSLSKEEFAKLKAAPPPITAADREVVKLWREESRKQLDELAKLIQDEIKLRDELGDKADDFFLKFLDDPALSDEVKQAFADVEQVQRFIGPRKNAVERMRELAKEMKKKDKK